MSPALAEHVAMLPQTLGSHVQITVLALLAALALALPLAMLVVQQPRLRAPVLGIVGVVQTVPALALLALMVPLLGGLSVLLGVALPSLGFVPTLIALTVYALLPILRNAVVGLTEVDPALIEAATGLGMSPTQVLTEVRLPLAVPVIVAGLRTATVWTVGMATLGTPVGQTCLGNHIFAGLQTRNHAAVLLGCLAAAGLALVLDAIVGAVEAALRSRSRRRLLAATAALATVLGAGLSLPLLAGSAPVGGTTVQIGAKNFTEQFILAAVISQTLEQAGLPTQRTEGLGSTVAFDALVTGELDVYVDYSGTLWANAMGREDAPGRQVVLDELTAWLAREHGVVCLGGLGFENAYALAMRSQQAQQLGVSSLADLAGHGSTLTLGADYEFLTRPEWAAVRDSYGLAFERERSFDPSFLYTAVRDGEADVISAFSSDGRIKAYDLVTLADPRQTLPPYDAVLLLSADAAARPQLVAALQPLIGSIDVDEMRAANAAVDLDGRAVGDVAATLR